MTNYITICGAKNMPKETLEAIVKAAEIARQTYQKKDKEICGVSNE